jgi:hypothetical protein
MPAGYSATPLTKKLGITPGHRLALLGAPASVVDELDLDGVTVRTTVRRPLDVVVLFVTARSELARRLPTVLRALEPEGMVWVSWPKKAAKVATDMTEDVVRDVALPMGVVDNKVAAIDDVWSGLKLVVRKEHRATWPDALLRSGS